MKNSLMRLLKIYADDNANLASSTLREKLSEDIIDIATENIIDIVTEKNQPTNINQMNLFDEISNS